MIPKDKYWPVTEMEIGRELGNPEWVKWADARIAELENKLVRSLMATALLDEMEYSFFDSTLDPELKLESIEKSLKEWIKTKN